MLGRTLGHYQIVEEIGSGGMGVVYRARDERLARDVAVKVILPGALVTDAAKRRFHKEALALSKLNHPNIATIHDFDSQDGMDFVVMELLEGITLSQTLRDRKLVEAEAVRIGRQIASALEEAHEHGIVHRDLKPGNIMLGNKGQAKLLDFGLATGMTTSEEAEATISVTSPGLVAGTVPYMSPEQVRGETVDARSDIWAAGAVLYEMATGERAFPEKNGPSLIGAILHRAPQSPRELNPDISPGLESIIVRALEKQPAQRFQSAGEMQVALEQVQLATQSLSGLRRANPPPRSRRWLLVPVAIAVLLSAAFLARRYWMPADTAAPFTAHLLVLVGDLENRTGESVFDHTLQEFLKTGIEQSRTVSVFPASRLRDALGRMQRPPTTVISEAIGREVCQREGLHAVIVGSISKLGTNYVLLARAVSPEGVSLASEQRTAHDAGDVPAQLDGIVQGLRTGLGESLSSVEATSVPLQQVTSASLDAVRYFTLGKQRLDAGDPAEAVSWFEKAIGLDGSFAMARGYLGIAYQNLNRLDRAEEELHAATQLADRINETERLKILGDYNVLIGNYEAGCNAFAALSRLKPEDPAPFHGLGICHVRRMQYDEALAANEKALALLAAIPTRHNSARTYLVKGDLDRARERAESVLRDSPANINARRIVGRVYQLRGETSEAARVFEEMIAAGGVGLVSGRVALADLYLATGRFRAARPILDAQVAAAEARGDAVAAARARIMIAEWLAESGQREQAAQLLSKIDQSPRDPALIMRLGRAYARVGRPAEAQKILIVMQAVTTAKPNPHLRSLQGIMAAALATASGRKSDAVQHAEAARALEPSVLAVDELARAYDDAGKVTEAVKSYEEVLARAAERADLDDDPSFRRVVDIHYRLGVLLQDASRPADARSHLETFLKFWSNADATLAIKRDATARVRRLAQARRTAAGSPTPAA
jgi:serine/threonine protein kinase/Tfp pilus assembly protein PilF